MYYLKLMTFLMVMLIGFYPDHYLLGGLQKALHRLGRGLGGDRPWIEGG